MPIEPSAPVGFDPDERRAAKLAELERRVANLERGAPAIQTGPLAPTSSPRDGTPYVADTPRLWLRVAGVWRYVTLT